MIDVADHLNLARKIAWDNMKKYPQHENDDVLADAYVGLAKAGKRFDASRGVKFSTYAVHLIKGEIQRAYRDDKEVFIRRGKLLDKSRFKSLNSMIYINETPIEFGNNISDDFDFTEQVERNEDIKKALGSLTDREMAVIIGLFWDEKTQEQLGYELGIKQVMVSRIKIRALKKLKEALTNDVA